MTYRIQNVNGYHCMMLCKCSNNSLYLLPQWLQYFPFRLFDESLKFLERSVVRVLKLTCLFFTHKFYLKFEVSVLQLLHFHLIHMIVNIYFFTVSSLSTMFQCDHVLVINYFWAFAQPEQCHMMKCLQIMELRVSGPPTFVRNTVVISLVYIVFGCVCRSLCHRFD